MEFLKQSYKFIRQASLWEESIVASFSTLKKLNQIEDINQCLGKMSLVFGEVKGKPNQQANRLQLSQTLATIHLLRCKLHLQELRKEYQKSQLQLAFDSFAEASVQLKEGGAKLVHFEIVLALVTKLLFWVESFNLALAGMLSRAFRLLTFSQEALFLLEESIASSLKYSLLIEKESECSKTPLMLYYYRVKVQQASCMCTLGVVKQCKKQSLSRLTLAGQPSEDEEPDSRHEELGKKAEIPAEGKEKEDQRSLKEYLAKLTRKVDKLLSPNPKRLESFEIATAYLINALNKVPASQNLYIVTQVELARSRRLQAEARLQFLNLWGDESELQPADEDENDQPAEGFEPDFKSESLSQALFFTKELEDNTEQFFTNKHASLYLKKFYF